MARETLAEDHTSDQVSVSEPLEVLGVVREGDIFPETISFDVRMPHSGSQTERIHPFIILD